MKTGWDKNGRVKGNNETYTTGKEVTLSEAGSHYECPWNIKRLKKHDLWYDDL